MCAYIRYIFHMSGAQRIDVELEGTWECEPLIQLVIIGRGLNRWMPHICSYACVHHPPLLFENQQLIHKTTVPPNVRVHARMHACTQGAPPLHHRTVTECNIRISILDTCAWRLRHAQMLFMFASRSPANHRNSMSAGNDCSHLLRAAWLLKRLSGAFQRETGTIVPRPT